MVQPRPGETSRPPRRVRSLRRAGTLVTWAGRMIRAPARVTPEAWASRWPVHAFTSSGGCSAGRCRRMDGCELRARSAAPTAATPANRDCIADCREPPGRSRVYGKVQWRSPRERTARSATVPDRSALEVEAECQDSNRPPGVRGVYGSFGEVEASVMVEKAEGRKFCKACGTPAARGRCEHCGQVLELSDRYGLVEDGGGPLCGVP